MGDDITNALHSNQDDVTCQSIFMQCSEVVNYCIKYNESVNESILSFISHYFSLQFSPRDEKCHPCRKWLVQRAGWNVLCRRYKSTWTLLGKNVISHWRRLCWKTLKWFWLYLLFICFS